MGRVHALGGEQRIDLVEEELFGQRLLGQIEIRIRDQADAPGGEKRAQLRLQRLLLAQLLSHHRGAGVDLLLGQEPVHRQLAHPGADLLLEAADSFHEKFIQVAGMHRQEEDPLEQRHPVVLGLVQHPPVEGEPGQLPVEIPLRLVEVGDGRRRGRLGGVLGHGGPADRGGRRMIDLSFYPARVCRRLVFREDSMSFRTASPRHLLLTESKPFVDRFRTGR